MSSSDIEYVNMSLYNAAAHLLEAGKYLSNIEEFRAYAKDLFDAANHIVDTIQPTQQKVTSEKINDILSEIFKGGSDAA